MNNDFRDEWSEAVWQYRKYSDDETRYRKAVVRNRDNKALATGYSRKGCEKVAEVFRSLGIECRVVGCSGSTTGTNFMAWNKNGDRVIYGRRDTK